MLTTSAPCGAGGWSPLYGAPLCWHVLQGRSGLTACTGQPLLHWCSAALPCGSCWSTPYTGTQLAAMPPSTLGLPCLTTIVAQLPTPDCPMPVTQVSLPCTAGGLLAHHAALRLPWLPPQVPHGQGTPGVPSRACPAHSFRDLRRAGSLAAAGAHAARVCSDEQDIIKTLMPPRCLLVAKKVCWAPPAPALQC